jgi:predicted metal-dependent phosphoesterase TrpH
VPTYGSPTEARGGAPSTPSARGRQATAFLDLHVHTSASFDCLASPASVIRAAASRGLTHVAITDHDRIDGALEARDLAATIAPGLTVIVGQEVKTREGDLICVFLERAIPTGLPAAEVIAETRNQGGLVGIPHPFDRFRGSLLASEAPDGLVSLVDWVEAHNARVMVRKGNERAAAFARERGMAGVAVSDAHSAIEIGVAYIALGGDPSTPAGLLGSLSGAELVTGRASVFIRVVTPLAKLVQRARGNGRAAAVR